jgi:hypothetical protein
MFALLRLKADLTPCSNALDTLKSIFSIVFCCVLGNVSCRFFWFAALEAFGSRPGHLLTGSALERGFIKCLNSSIALDARRSTVLYYVLATVLCGSF